MPVSPPELTLAQLRAMRGDLQERLRAAIHTEVWIFQQRTGVTVQAVRVDVGAPMFQRLGDDPRPVVRDVTVDLGSI